MNTNEGVLEHQTVTKMYVFTSPGCSFLSLTHLLWHVPWQTADIPRAVLSSGWHHCQSVSSHSRETTAPGGSSP